MIEIQRNRIDVDSIVNTVRRDDAGAIVVFLGTVRSDPDVRALDYEVYRPMALRTLADKMNWLIEGARPAGRGPYTNAEVSSAHTTDRRGSPANRATIHAVVWT